jgi:hypothetical protein
MDKPFRPALTLALAFILTLGSGLRTCMPDDLMGSAPISSSEHPPRSQPDTAEHAQANTYYGRNTRPADGDGNRDGVYDARAYEYGATSSTLQAAFSGTPFSGNPPLNGSAWYISGAPDERWDNDALHELHQVHGSDFEAVDVSSLMIHPNSGQAQTSR